MERNQIRNGIGKVLFSVTLAGALIVVQFVYPEWRNDAMAQAYCGYGYGPCPPVDDEVEIDIKPGSDKNPINPRSRGVIPVAILSSDTFDALQVDPTTLAFGPGGAGIAHKTAHAKNVDGDSYVDLIVHFRNQEAAIPCGATEAELTGETYAGVEFAASDSVTTVGKLCK
ncbi:MAG: hypothetical protein ACR2QW_15760 [bacterium]